MKPILTLFLTLFSMSALYAQVGINADNSAPHSSAQLDVKSTTKAFYPPRMTTTQKNAIASPQAGATVFDITLNQLSYYNGSAWVSASGSGDFNLPVSKTGAGDDYLFSIEDTTTQNGYGYGIKSKINSRGGTAIFGIAKNKAPDPNSPFSGTTYGVIGSNNSENSNGVGVYGYHFGGGIGVRGFSSSGIGGSFTSTSGYSLITETGNVGIGVDDPSYILDVESRLRVRHKVDTTPDDNTAGIWYNNSSNVEAAFIGMKTDNQIGTFIGGTWRFWVDNMGAGYLNGNLIQTSDKRLKKDFSKLNNSLTDIYKINGYHFRWIEEARNKDLQTGFIAQEVQKIFPELVQTDDKGFLSVNYIGLIPHLLEAVKELKNENSTLKNENNSFKTNQTKLDSRMDKLEKLLNSFAKNTALN